MTDSDTLSKDLKSDGRAVHPCPRHPAEDRLDEFKTFTEGWAGDGEGAVFPTVVLRAARDIVALALHHGLWKAEVHPTKRRGNSSFRLH